MRILIIDDHPLTCNGLRLLLGAAYPGARIDAHHAAATANAAIEQSINTPANASPGASAGAVTGQPDAYDWIFLDIGLPDDPERRLLNRLSAAPFAARTVLISAEVVIDVVRKALRAGMRGFIPKSADPALVLDGVQKIFSGEVYLPPDLASASAFAPEGQDAKAQEGERHLTPRQRQVLALILKGCPNKTIARELDLTLNTVKEYVSVLLRLHGVSTRLELVLKLRQAP
jgi:two-component system, NarL family, nitrate/nitrite response regulator NarL